MRMKNYNALMCDVECYINYFLVMFKVFNKEKYYTFETTSEFTAKQHDDLLKLLRSNTIVTFNGLKYDSVVMDCALSNDHSNVKSINEISHLIIKENDMPWIIRKRIGVRKREYDHIDLIEVAPGKGTLKLYGGRLHCPKLQDLPIDPYEKVNKEQQESLKLYCKNDLQTTEALFVNLSSQIELRESLGKRYSLDLRSKSDAQIAETVIKKHLENEHGISVKKPLIQPRSSCRKFFYKPPAYMDFDSTVLQNVFNEFTSNPFFINDKNKLDFNFTISDADKKKDGSLPLVKRKFKFKLGDMTYTVGMGGLHSYEKSTSHHKGTGILREYDVASYYPFIVLNNKIYPKNIGLPFLQVYRRLVDERLQAKRSGDTVTSDALKIAINGTFGKLGSQWSYLHSPELLMQVTVTGQLTLLMLIEALECRGIRVISANTDSVFVKTKDEKSCQSVIDDWEFDTGYTLGKFNYDSLYSRDVNNYIAVSESGIKAKGAYADRNDAFYQLRSNPSNQICVEAATRVLKGYKGTSSFIRASQDVKKFITIRTVKGGAIKDDEYLGKVVRWYRSSTELDAIYYAKNGNKVPKSDFGKPLMQLPDELPSDIDYDWYIGETKSILHNVGYSGEI